MQGLRVVSQSFQFLQKEKEISYRKYFFPKLFSIWPKFIIQLQKELTWNRKECLVTRHRFSYCVRCLLDSVHTAFTWNSRARVMRHSATSTNMSAARMSSSLSMVKDSVFRLYLTHSNFLMEFMESYFIHWLEFYVRRASAQIQQRKIIQFCLFRFHYEPTTGEVSTFPVNLVKHCIDLPRIHFVLHIERYLRRLHNNLCIEHC